MKKNIVLFHYHLKPGGVTTVIRHQVEALKECCNVMILTGELPDQDWEVPIETIPELGYNQKNLSPQKNQHLADKIINAISKHFKTELDVMHIHNPLLAKNKNFLKILEILQRKGIKLFLQIHDFAEDGRALAYFFEEYPAHCHYGVINSRDYQILLKAGLTPEGLHKISNIVVPLKIPKVAKNTEKTLLLYPVRGIRRKNIGEAILLSLFLKEKETIGLTLPPSTKEAALSKDVPIYLKWKEFVKKQNLKFEFEVGLTNNFLETVAKAKMIITTSMTEGFGFSFLEPWTADKFLVGRKIPEICIDFEEAGINLDKLYTHLYIPLELFNHQKFFNQWKSCILQNSKLMLYPLTTKDLNQAADNLPENDCIDFQLFNEATQRQIILNIIKDKKNKQLLIRYNPWIENFSDTTNTADIIKNNKKIVLAHYNIENYKNKLLTIYNKVISQPVNQQINKKILLRSFFNFHDFSLLKWSN